MYFFPYFTYGKKLAFNAFWPPVNLFLILQRALGYNYQYSIRKWEKMKAGRWKGFGAFSDCFLMGAWRLSLVARRIWEFLACSGVFSYTVAYFYFMRCFRS